MTRIVRFETWVCRRDFTPGTGPAYRGSSVDIAKLGAQVILIRLTTDDGVEGIATAQAAHTPKIALAYLNDVIAPVVLGRDPTDREAIWQELLWLNRQFLYFPTNLPGPIDVALWDIAAKSAQLPLYRFLGAYRTTIPVYVSGQFLPKIDDYGNEAGDSLARGIAGYKIHPTGDWRSHIEIAEAVRAKHPSLTLMMDPVGNYSLTQAVTVGRALEKLGFTWLEEPFPDYSVGKYAELCRTLDISILACEASTGGPAGVAEFIRSRAADIVRADVVLKWGVTGMLKIMRLAEAFGLNCEPHSPGMGPMDLATLHVACAAANADWFEVMTPSEASQFPMANAIEVDQEGLVHVTDTPGIGAEIDWNIVDDSTLVRTDTDSDH